MSETVNKNIGHATAYGYAKSKGYTGTEEQFAELMASYADVGQTAVDAALAAKASEDAAKASETASAASQAAAATSAGTATTAAHNAAQSAQAAQADADAAALDASQALSAASTAGQKATEAAQSATAAAGSATTAGTAATAAQTAQTAAETAQGKAEDAQAAAEAAAQTLVIDPTLTQANQAAEAKATGDAITLVKSQLEAVEPGAFYENPTNQIGEYVQGYWSIGAFNPTSAYQGRKITIPEGAKKVHITGPIAKYYDYYDFLDANDNVLSYERKMVSGNADINILIPSGAVYVGVSTGSAPEAKLVVVRFLYYTSSYIDDIKENTNSIAELQSTEIEGYEKIQWIDITARATLTEGKYAEMINGSIVISNGGYKYAVLDVSPGETYKTSGLNVYDMRPAIYTNDDGNILLYEPTQRVTTWQYVTVETTAPEGATKLYVDGRTSDNIVIQKKGAYYQKEETDTAPKITVRINRNEYPDTSIITDEFKQTAEVFNSTEQPNHAVLPRAVFVNIDGTWKTIVNNEDDNCPVSLSSGYLGAGHGYDRAFKITLTDHGKTYADIGSEWESGTQYLRRWWIVRIIDADNLVIIGNHSLIDNEYDTNGWGDGNTLRHISGAVHTDDMTGFTRTTYLLAPVDKNHVKKVMLDGVTEVSADGEYEATAFVDIIDEYDIVNPQSIAPELVANKPSGGYTENPPINTGDAFLHFSNVYRYLLDGTLLLFTTLDNSVNVTLAYWGATQYAQKSAANAFGGALFRYIPKVLPMDSHELRIPFNMANWNFTVNATTQYWEDADNPPDRLLHLYTDGNGKYAAGFAVGYLPIAEGAAAVRKTNVSNAMHLYNTKKAYFRLVDSGGVNGNAWTAFKPFQSICYRKPVMDVADIHTDAYFVPLGEKCYMYADYHAIADDRIKVPAEYVGKPMTVVEKSSNVTVYGTIATDEIRIRCATAEPMYGYAVIQIG